ncbi:MAG: 3-hydroxyacyl-CoA dehydrogenase, partial [Pseudomonadota bacterium]
MTDFTMTVGDDGVAIITWDCPGKSMNVMSATGFAELDALVDQVLGDDAIKGAVITSGKRDFAGGMDLNVLAGWKAEGGDNPAPLIFDGIMSGHAAMRKIERAGMDPKTLKGGKPIVAALPGIAMGIGYEIALACHRIFA